MTASTRAGRGRGRGDDRRAMPWPCRGRSRPTKALGVAGCGLRGWRTGGRCGTNGPCGRAGRRAGRTGRAGRGTCGKDGPCGSGAVWVGGSAGRPVLSSGRAGNGKCHCRSNGCGCGAGTAGGADPTDPTPNIGFELFVQSCRILKTRNEKELSHEEKGRYFFSKGGST